MSYVLGALIGALLLAKIIGADVSWVCVAVPVVAWLAFIAAGLVLGKWKS